MLDKSLKDGIAGHVNDTVCNSGQSFPTVGALVSYLVNNQDSCIISQAPSATNIQNQYGVNNVKMVVTTPDITVAPTQTGYTPVRFDVINANITYSGYVSDIMSVPVNPLNPSTNTNLSELGQGGVVTKPVAKVWYYTNANLPAVKTMSVGKIVIWGAVALVGIVVIWNLTKGKKGRPASKSEGE